MFQSQIYLLLQIAFCQRVRKKTNNWLYLLFHNVKVYEAICHDQLYQMLFVSQKNSTNKNFIIYCLFSIFNADISHAYVQQITFFFEIQIVFILNFMVIQKSHQLLCISFLSKLFYPNLIIERWVYTYNTQVWNLSCKMGSLQQFLKCLKKYLL